MPKSPKKLCSSPGCRKLSVSGKSKCEACSKEYSKVKEAKRGTACQRGYGYRWQKTSHGFLRNNPLCVECHNSGKIEPAIVTDHIIPHKGDMTLFWSRVNWQPLCKKCHDKKTAFEDGGFGR